MNINIIVYLVFLRLQEFELSLFLEQVREPTTLTAAGVVAVNKDFGLTVILSNTRMWISKQVNENIVT